MVGGGAIRHDIAGHSDRSRAATAPGPAFRNSERGDPHGKRRGGRGTGPAAMGFLDVAFEQL